MIVLLEEDVSPSSWS